MKRFSLFSLAITALLLTNCEDPIDVPSPFEGPTIAVDAWLTNTDNVQTIILNETVDYFAGGEPASISDATITVCRNENEACFVFAETAPGTYQWTPPAGETLGSVGDGFNLTIAVRDQTLTSSTVLNRTATIDSISLTFEEGGVIFEEGIYAEVYARDQMGLGDTYWMKTWKNDTLLTRSEENTITTDGAFDSGTGIDGLYFLPPLRNVNAIDDDGGLVPYVAGDSIYVEVHSISNEAFNFLAIAFEQIENEGIFALPIANARGNVSSSTGETILGIFNVAEVVSISQVIE